MDILNEAYYKAFAENEKNWQFWENYLQNLKSLDFNQFNAKLKVPVLVPIGSRILFRGELKHTNELTVSLGADYFVKCSVKQAEVLRQHRIKDAESKLNTLMNERSYLENQITFTKTNVFEKEGQEIIEYQTEEEDKAWREKHRENMRQYKQTKGKKEESTVEINDEELWNRLEELELQEELENELLKMDNAIESREQSFISKEDNVIIEKQECNIKKKEKDIYDSKIKLGTLEGSKYTKLNLLHQVIDRQKTLESKLSELKNREMIQSKTEQDLLSKLDEMEQLDELEDEMDRLDDIIENEDVGEEKEGDSDKLQTTKLQRRVSFVDDDDSETLELTFKHTPTEPNSHPYNPEKGIQKPSDIYQAYSRLFESETTSILKKSRYESEDVHSIKTSVVNNKEIPVNKSAEDITHEEIVIKDVVEKVGKPDIEVQIEARPISLFKKRRMQSKT